MEGELFPFSAILGQDQMQYALTLSVVDPKIGGVLLLGQQGTGKSTAVRSLSALLPKIDVNMNCQFNCMPSDKANLCPYCQKDEKDNRKVMQSANLVTLPLGATDDMVVGSVDIENLLLTGKTRIQPGILAKAHRGVLYIDEVNLLSDFLLDLLLDVVTTKVNRIERDGISFSHNSDFLLVGSMNPEEGILRPQILERFSLIIEIKAPKEVQIRSTITQRAIEFEDDSKVFIEKYQNSQKLLKHRIMKARSSLNQITFSKTILQFVSNLVSKFPSLSQRVELVFLRVSRAIAAYHGENHISKSHLKDAMFLVLSGKIAPDEESDSEEFLGEMFDVIWQNITHFPGNSEDLQNPDYSVKLQIYKSTLSLSNQYHEKPYPKSTKNIPELQSGERNSKDRNTTHHLDDPISEGYKVGDFKTSNKKVIQPLGEIPSYHIEKPLNIDVSPILNFLNTQRKIVHFTGRGSRLRILTRNTGRFVFAQKPKKNPSSIAFNATIKNHLISYPHSLQKVRDAVYASDIQHQSELAINIKYDDIREKINELHAPLSLYFIVDASASMRRTLKQTIKVIQSVHAEGYAKKDKISVISFQGRVAQILQRPSVSFSVGMKQLRTLKATSYTPLASALNITTTMIRQEQIKGHSIPIIIILSDLGANISLKFPEMNASSREDFTQIAQELENIAKMIGNRGYRLVVMKPIKSFATRFLGVDQISVQRIETSFIRDASALIFEFDGWDTENTIKQLKQITK